MYEYTNKVTSEKRSIEKMRYFEKLQNNYGGRLRELTIDRLVKTAWRRWRTIAGTE